MIADSIVDTDDPDHFSVAKYGQVADITVRHDCRYFADRMFGGTGNDIAGHGRRNKATLALEALLDGEGEAVTRKGH